MSELGSQIRKKAALAVEQFQERAGGRLNYSEQSISTVEEMLAEAADWAPKMTAKDLTALVHLMGSYILEVAFRAYGGAFYWHNGRDQPVLVVGAPKYKVALMTFEKVRGRLSGDKADNVVFFYEGFSKRVRSATPGTDALYV